MIIFCCIYLTIGLVVTIIFGLIGFFVLKKWFSREETIEYARDNLGNYFISDSNIDFFFNVGLVVCMFIWPYVLFNVIKAMVASNRKD